MAQHLWAASSHVLQYKQESSVPPPMRRAIYRVSALLETIDLEFERLLIEREEYAGAIDVESEAETLNVDSLEKVLSTVCPPQNRSISEDFSDLLQDLLAFEVRTPDQLTKIVTKHRSSALKQDADQVKRELRDNQAPSDRLKSGVYFAWTGLTRIACESEFGKAFTNYLLAQFMPLSHLQLPEPIVNLLRGGQILRVCELAAVTERRLKGLLESNENYFRQIVEALGKVGLHLGMAEAHAARKLIDHPQWKILIEELPG